MNIFEDPSRTMNRIPPSGWVAEMRRLAYAVSQSADCDLIGTSPRPGTPSRQFDDFARDLGWVLEPQPHAIPYANNEDQAAAALKAGADTIRARVMPSSPRGWLFDDVEISSTVLGMVRYMERAALAHQNPLEYHLLQLEESLGSQFTPEEKAACRSAVAALWQRTPPTTELA